MIDTQKFRDKYALRKNSRGIMFTPIGGKDVIRLCDVVDRLMLLVNELKATEERWRQVQIEQRLRRI